LGLGAASPALADAAVATSWLYDNGSFLEPRFALPANGLQSSFEIPDAGGNAVFKLQIYQP